MTEVDGNQDQFLDDLAPIVDGEQDALDRHADRLAGSDADRDLRYEASRVAELVRDAAADFVVPDGLEANVLAAIDGAATTGGDTATTVPRGEIAPPIEQPLADDRSREGAGTPSFATPAEDGAAARAKRFSTTQADGSPVTGGALEVARTASTTPATEGVAPAGRVQPTSPSFGREPQPGVGAKPSAGSDASQAKGRPRSKILPFVSIATVGIGLAAAAAVGIVYLQNATTGGPAAPPPIAASTLSARITAIARAAADGQSGVEIELPGAGAASAASAGVELGAGSRLRTDDRTRVELVLSDGSRVVLNHSTEVLLRADAARRLDLIAGELVADVAHQAQGPDATFGTPTGDVKVLGTKFVLSATEELASVRVTRGEVELETATGQHQGVKAGQEGLMPKSDRMTVAPVMELASALRWSELDATVEAGAEAEPLAGIGELRARRPGEQSDRERPLSLAHHKVTVRVVGNVARTEIEETFRNDGEHILEGIYRFPMPADARIANLALDVNGQWEEGAFVEKDRAQRIWRGVIRNATPEAQRVRNEEFIWVPGPWRDPALLEWQRGGRFELRIFPIPAHGERRVRLSYTQNIAPTATGRRYVYPLAHSADDSTRVGQFEVDVRVAGTGPGSTVRSHGYGMQSSQEGNATHLTFAANGFLPAGDIMIDYKVDDSDAELRWWTFAGQATAAAPARSREGDPAVQAAHQSLHQDSRPYVVFALRPELPAWTESRRSDYVLVLDSSQSMVGERFERAAHLAQGIVGELDRRDRFVVMTCDSACRTMDDSPTPPSAQTAAQVGQWLQSVVPAGSSDLVATLRAAGEAMAGKRSPDRDVHVIYIGDGLASVGHRRPASLAAEVSDLANDPHLSVTTVGIGGDADSLALSAIARAGGGHYVPYVPGQRTSLAALSVLETTYGVSLEEAEIEMPDGVVDVAPRKLPTIRAGEEVIVVGRLAAGAVRGSVRLRGRIAGRDFDDQFPVTLTPESAQGNAFVPRLWASKTIEQLELEGKGEDEPQIVALSKAFGVMSRHTSLLVLESEAMFRAFGVDRNQPTLQWTGDEDMVMGESSGMVEHQDGTLDALDSLAGMGGGGGDLRASGASTGAGFGRASSSRAGASAAGPLGQSAPPAPAATAPRAMRPMEEPVIEAAADRSDSVDEDVSGGREQARAEAPRARRSRRPPNGQWMRRVWYREGAVSTAVEPTNGERNALRAAQDALRESPDSRDRHRELVRQLSRAGELDEARGTVEKWIERDRLDPEALTYLADVLGRMGKRDDSLRVLSGIVDLEPDNRVLQERLANAFERAGMAAKACAHRVSLAEMATDDTEAMARAVRCERALQNETGARSLLGAVTDVSVQGRIREMAATAETPPAVRGDLMLDATWSQPTDLDISLVTPQGTRLSWMGGRTTVVGDDATARGHERLGLRRSTVGSYLVEVARADPADTTEVRGQVQINVLGERRTLPFTLQGERAVIGRVGVVRRSRMEAVSGVPRGVIGGDIPPF